MSETIKNNMEIFISNAVQFLGSPTFGVVLTLLLIFQWYRQHAKEQAVKNILFAMRRKVLRSINKNSSTIETEKAYDMVDDIDAILATLDSRKPFSKNLNQVIDMITERNNLDKQKELLDFNVNNLNLDILSLSETPVKLMRSSKRNGV